MEDIIPTTSPEPFIDEIETVDRFKFRIWDRKNHCFRTSRELFFLSDEGELFFDELMPVRQRDNYIIQQSTGLKDKNGKLIYEGDIIQTPGYPLDYIIWDSGCFCLKYAITNYELTQGVFGSEIVGNLFEYPEMLNLPLAPNPTDDR